MIASVLVDDTLPGATLMIRRCVVLFPTLKTFAWPPSVLPLPSATLPLPVEAALAPIAVLWEFDAVAPYPIAMAPLPDAVDA
nr:hypothetical protein [Burkholderia seminalis]